MSHKIIPTYDMNKKRGRSCLLSLFCLCYVTISDLFLEFNIHLIAIRRQRYAKFSKCHTLKAKSFRKSCKFQKKFLSLHQERKGFPPAEMKE